jgi:hypothetical protein
MDLQIFNQRELVLVARALRGIARADGAVTASEEAIIEGLARIHGVAIDASQLEPIEPTELARSLTDPHRRKRALQLAIVTALVEGTPSEARLAAVRGLADALETPEAGLAVLYELSHGRALLARFDMVRRIRGVLTAQKNFPGYLKFLEPLLGVGGEAPELAARYHALAHCRAGSLGHGLYQHYRRNGFAFPGEKNGIPEFAVFHDVGHVLSGYGTDPEGEIQQAAFQAGFSRHDGFTFLLFGILQFHLGLRLTPIAHAERGFFDVPRVLRAVERGAACKQDIAEFDLFAHAQEPLAALRARLGIPPLPEAEERELASA